MEKEPTVYIVELYEDGTVKQIPCIFKKDAIDYLGITEQQVRNYQKQGRLRTITPGTEMRKRLRLNSRSLLMPFEDVKKIKFGDWKNDTSPKK